jgi:hypothetical protein
MRVVRVVVMVRIDVAALLLAAVAVLAALG